MSQSLPLAAAPCVIRRGLFWKYAISFSALVGALLVLSGGLGGYFAFRQATVALDDLQRAKANFAAEDIESSIGQLESALQSTVAKFNASDAVDEENLRLELISLSRHQPAITELFWLRADGSERLSLSRVGRDSVGSGRDWSHDPQFQGARSGQKYVGPVIFREGTEPYLSLAVSRNAGGPVLVADVNLHFVGEVISKLHFSSGVAYVIDGQGRLISHPDSSLALGKLDFSSLPQVRRAFGWNTVESARNVEGLPVLATGVPITHLGWTVFAEQPLREALRPVYASIATSIVLVLLGLASAVLASLILARHMVRPIRQIEASAREIGDGKFDRRIDVKTGDELEALGLQFNLMAARLQETYATQETRIAERTRDLAVANEAKTRFLAVASHDLRQPLHALALFVGQLRAMPVLPDTCALVERIDNSVDALRELLESLLDLSKLDVGTVTPHPQTFALNGLLKRLVMDFSPVAESKGLALTVVPTSLWVRTDPLLLERILLNLIGNAIRYTVEGHVLIGCRRKRGFVDLVVADSGVGISAVHLPHVFQEFYRVGSQPGLPQGLGLGLAIVKRLSLLLEHPISIASIPGKGTIIRVSIQRSMPPALPRQPTAIVKDLHGIRILVVDDEAPAREAISGLLTQWGCEVATGEGLQDALEHARARRPDLVLCDLNLAGESGLDVVHRLRMEHGPELTCAFVTGESGPDQVAQVQSSGYQIAFKPTKPAKLRALVEHLLSTGDK